MRKLLWNKHSEWVYLKEPDHDYRAIVIILLLLFIIGVSERDVIVAVCSYDK